MTIQTEISMLIPEERLGAIQLHFVNGTDDCVNRLNGDECVPEDASVDPSFFETSGTPICSECGADMTCFSATVNT